MKILAEAVNAQKQNKAFALATIVKTIGCTPRGAGTRMLVYDDGTISGTVGGGDAEKAAVEDCLLAIRTGQPMLKHYNPETLAPGKEPDCSKDITVFIEPAKRAPYLYILGAGHVAQSVLPYASKLGFHTVVLDPRDMEPFEKELSLADERIKTSSFSGIAGMDLVPGSYFLICTWSHATDEEALAAVLDKKAAYIGMLGAKHKFVPIYRRLIDKGYTVDRLKEIYAPAGLDIGGQAPDEIAIGIMSEIMSVRYNRSSRPLRDVKRDSIFADF